MQFCPGETSRRKYRVFKTIRNAKLERRIWLYVPCSRMFLRSPFHFSATHMTPWLHFDLDEFLR